MSAASVGRMTFIVKQFMNLIPQIGLFEIYIYIYFVHILMQVDSEIKLVFSDYLFIAFKAVVKQIKEIIEAQRL